jgi:hypothetical protein
MDTDEDDGPVGLPVMKPRPKGDAGVKPAFPEHEPQAVDAGRHPDDEAGIPNVKPAEMHETTEAENEAIRKAEDLEATRVYAQMVEQATLGRFDRFNTWRRRANRVLLLGASAVLALLGLFVYAHAVQILAALAFEPLLIKVSGYAALVALVGVLAAFAARLLLFFFRLGVNQQISATQLRQLSNRADLRALVQRDQSAAKKRLEQYLREYPLDERGSLDAVGMLRMDEDRIRRLRAARVFLLDPDRFTGFDSWLNDFRERFQDELQAAADQALRDWTKLVGIQTAFSRKPWLDSAITLYCSFGMIGDLCALYNLRMTGSGTIRLLGFTLFNAYTASRLDDVVDYAGGIAGSLEIDKYIAPLFETVGGVVGLAGGPAGALAGSRAGKSLGTLAGKAAGDATKMAIEGAASALLMRKLARTTIIMLRPVDPGN